MIKLFLSDIDGTLLRGSTGVHPDVTEAIRRFIKEGGKFGLCTGRALPALLPIINMLPVNAPCIACGGSIVYDPAIKKIIYEHPLDDSVFDFINVVLCEYPDVSITACLRDEIVNIRVNDRLLRKGIPEDSGAPIVSLDKVKEPMKLLLSCDDPETLAEIARKHVDKSVFSFLASGVHFHELMPRGADKGSAVREAAKAAADSEGCRLFTAGDASSDLAMKAASELFFAPENALNSVKKGADIIVPTPEEAGVAKALEKVMSI